MRLFERDLDFGFDVRTLAAKRGAGPCAGAPAEHALEEIAEPAAGAAVAEQIGEVAEFGPPAGRLPAGRRSEL
jgi:hypothetical protein